ncbi:MAG: glutaredoxin [Cyanobacteria bacterium SIG29]|nr:glutaredoxin [Cyanobacteria bacterium SIG29]
MKDVVIYYLDYCPYCVKAMKLLDGKNIPYKKIDISPNEEEYRKHIGQYYGIQGNVTVPQIIIGNERIGGFDNLEKLNNSGELDKILEN